MMLPALEPARSLRGFAVVLVCGLAFCLAGCDDPGGDPRAQIGPNPVLPEPTQYLMPPMRVAKVVPWKKDETPTVPQGLKRPWPPGWSIPVRSTCCLMATFWWWSRSHPAPNR
jgi:hypothetical protein